MTLALPVPAVARVIAILVMASLASPAWAQHLAGGISPNVSIVRIIAALAISLVAGIGLVLMQRRFPAGKGAGQIWAAFSGTLARSRRINIIEARRISPHADICLVRCDADEYLILSGPGGLTVLRSGLVAQGAADDAFRAELPQ